jgi:hypothetical protein
MKKTQVERRVYRTGDFLELESVTGACIAVYCGTTAAYGHDRLEFYFPSLNPYRGTLVDLVTDNIFRVLRVIS